jgi:hypothetical protein
MSIRRTDVRFTLPKPPGTAVVLGEIGGWRDGLTGVGVDLVPETRDAADLVVASRRRAADAIARGANAVILEGPGGAAALRRAGYTTSRYLPLPNLDEPDVVLPLRRGSASRYALERWRRPATLLKRVRNRAAVALLEHDVFPDLRGTVTVGVRDARPPFPLAAAAELGIPLEVDWFLAPGHGDTLTRLVFHLFPSESVEPRWVLKMARVPGYREPFDRDQRGLELVREAGAAVAAHAPALLGRFEVGGLHGSVETAAVGEQLSALATRDPTSARRLVDVIAAWILRLGRATAAAPEALADERRRLETLIRLHPEVPPDVLHRLPPLPAVVQHNDLGTWNIVVQPSGDFLVLDWESAHAHGFPLWDLLYFLVDVLPLLAGAVTPQERVEEAIRLLRGDSRSSDVLFRWVATAAEGLSVPPEAVGAVATLGWLHHAYSRVLRARRLEAADAGALTTPSPIDRLAPLWLADPALGVNWKARAG